MTQVLTKKTSKNNKVIENTFIHFFVFTIAVMLIYLTFLQISLFFHELGHLLILKIEGYNIESIKFWSMSNDGLLMYGFRVFPESDYYSKATTFEKGLVTFGGFLLEQIVMVIILIFYFKSNKNKNRSFILFWCSFSALCSIPIYFLSDILMEWDKSDFDFLKQYNHTLYGVSILFVIFNSLLIIPIFIYSARSGLRFEIKNYNLVDGKYEK